MNTWPAWIEAGSHNAKTTLVFLHGIGGGKMGFESAVHFFAEKALKNLFLLKRNPKIVVIPPHP